jgi:hypothetical protein
MIVLAADMHKRSHTVAALAAATAELLDDKTAAVGDAGFPALVEWGRALGAERVWALEDCRHVSGSFERFLIREGERVVRVPTKLMAGARRGSRQRGKSDRIDAIAVARAAIAEGIDTCRARIWTGASSTCGCWSITATGSSAPASRSTTRCSGTCTTSGPSSRFPAADCSRPDGRRGSRGAWAAPNRPPVSGSRATNCATCANSPPPSTTSSARSPH